MGAELFFNIKVMWCALNMPKILIIGIDGGHSFADKKSSKLEVTIPILEKIFTYSSNYFLSIFNFTIMFFF